MWTNMSDAAQRKELLKWAIEKPKLVNVRKLRGTYFIDPPGAEFKETMKNVRKKMEVPMPAAMPCRTRREEQRETYSALDNRETKYACIVEADESTRNST